MSLTQSVFRSSAALTVGNAANKIVGITIMLAMARYLTAEQFGLYTYVFSFVVLLGIPTDIGFGQVLVREISRDEEGSRPLIGNAVLFRFSPPRLPTCSALASPSCSLGGRRVPY